MPKLIGLDWDERTAFEISRKGWFENAQLLMDDGSILPLSFWDPTRLSQELETSFTRGEQFFAERNLIVLPTVTKSAIRQAVEDLIARGFF